MSAVVVYDKTEQVALIYDTTTGLPLPVQAFTGYTAGWEAQEFMDWAEAKRDCDIRRIDAKILDRLRFAWPAEWDNRQMGRGEKQDEAKARDF